MWYSLFLLVMVNGVAFPVNAQQLYLNEIMASNAATIFDEDGDAEDWIEIYYDGDEPLNLEGYGLSDDYEQPMRWEFPDITIQPGEFLLIWASGKDRSDPGGELHTNFAIAMAGEEVLLTAPDGELIDELSPTRIPTDISLGRYPDGTGDWYFYTNPTPGEPNGSDSYQEILEPVTFSHEGGFYTSGFDLQLSHPDTNASIIYTLDGSEPDPENLNGTTYLHIGRYRPVGDSLFHSFESHKYDSSLALHISDRTDSTNYFSHMQTTTRDESFPYFFPIHSIFKGTIVRAKAIREGAVSSAVQTNSYFVTPDGNNRFRLPVISLTVQEDYLFDYETGIYVPGKIYNDHNPWDESGHADANYHRRGINWERSGSMELFERGSETADLRQDIGIRIHGGFSRSFPRKSLRLYARNEYGDNRFHYPMFPDEPYNEFNRLILRNSGNDWRQSLFRDAMIQKVIGHMKFETQAYRPFIVFINGEYWGIHNMRERYDKHYLARIHNVDPENIDLLTNSGLRSWEIKEGDNRHYRHTLEYIRDHGMEDSEHYEYIQTRIDVENFIDYQIAQIYSGNTDWPGNNIDFWRYRTGEYDPDAPPRHDGRWRWLAFDLDFGFYIWGGDGPDYNVLKHALGEKHHPWANPSWSTELLRSFLKNKQFVQDFTSRYLDQLNTAFSADRVTNIIREMAAHIKPEVPEHFQRWHSGQDDNNYNAWQDRIENHMVNYAEHRIKYARKHLKERFDAIEWLNISDEHHLTVDISDPAAGRIHVNTIEISPETAGIDPDPWPWTGIYFEDVPVTLNAEPWPGFRFFRWEVDDSRHYESELELSLTGTTTVTAVFYPDEESDGFPKAYDLRQGTYHFTEWSADAIDLWPDDKPETGYPENMAFVYMDESDPGPDADIAGFTEGVYYLSTRTRISGLDEDGFAFINTSSEEGNPGYPGTRLGGALLALNTRRIENIEVSWEGMTVEPNSRVYHLRLQYRLGDEGPFHDLLDEVGNPVEYHRNSEPGHREQIGPVQLPPGAENKGYIQLLWRYYHTGEQLDHESGQRAKLAVTNITVEPGRVLDAGEEPQTHLPESYRLHQNYPNPFNPATVIRYQLPDDSEVRLEVFDLLGRRVTTLVDGPVQAGEHTVSFDASELAGGVYIYRLQAGGYNETRTMTMIK